MTEFKPHPSYDIRDVTGIGTRMCRTGFTFRKEAGELWSRKPTFTRLPANSSAGRTVLLAGRDSGGD